MPGKIKYFFLIAIVSFASTACIPNNTTSNSSEKKASNTQPAEIAKTNEPTEPKPSPNEVKEEKAESQTSRDQNKGACLDLKRDELSIDEKQTFGIDFPPFGKSCFVVFHDPEFDDPPLNSQYFIYKDGKEAFAFPDQFNGSNIGCWLEAVSFEDMNGDGLNDIAIAAKCSAKSKPYPENMVYINTGKDFKTNVQANMEMMDFTKMSQIKQYVKEHQSLFAK